MFFFLVPIGNPLRQKKMINTEKVEKLGRRQESELCRIFPPGKGEQSRIFLGEYTRGFTVHTFGVVSEKCRGF